MTDKLDSLLTYFQRSAGAGNKLKNSRSFCLEFPAAHRASRRRNISHRMFLLAALWDGDGSSVAMSMTHMSHLAHKHSSLMPLVVPEVQAATRRYGVVLLFDLH
jgi:hypothetical protein